MQAVQSSVDKVITDMSGLEGLVASQMLVAAATWLRHVKSIATTYRMTARPPPSKPSHYASSLLRSPTVCPFCSRIHLLLVLQKQESTQHPSFTYRTTSWNHIVNW